MPFVHITSLITDSFRQSLTLNIFFHSSFVPLNFIDFKLSHPQNTQSDILLTVLGISKFYNDLQCLNVLSTISIAFLGHLKFVNFSQSLNAPIPINLTPSSIFTVSNL